MNVTYRVIIEPDKKGFHGFVPALKGCHTWGRTIAETKKHLQEAITLFLESLALHGDLIPHDVSFESFETVELPKVRRRKTVRQYA
jgi:predicted RNase H-like HicB family nuclease